MKKKILVTLLAISNFVCFSQREANIWYFGVNAGLDFNTGSPITLSDGIISTTEGCATICNSAGQLLFYTDGVVVRNRNHEIMLNGTNLNGHTSSTQSAIIIPKPNSNSVYYIFTVACISFPGIGGDKGLRYSEIDMNLNEGLGDVTSQKNIPITAPVCEKICAIRNAAGDGYWVVTHSFGNNSFQAIKIDATGIASVVTSSIGTSVGYFLPMSTFSAVGQLKISPDGKKLVCVNSFSDVQLFDFNTTTGVVSNVETLPSSGIWNCYGAEFSPSGSKLYLTATSNFPTISYLLQYDLNAANIGSSEILLYSTPTTSREFFGSLQLGPDGKIYGARFIENEVGPSYLNIINNPEITGIGCQFQPNQIVLTGLSQLGLPQFVQSIFELRITYEPDCYTNSTLFSLSGNLSILSTVWDFGDGTVSTDTNPNHIYSSSGTYTVIATVTTSVGISTLTQVITILQVPEANPVNTVTLCDLTNSTYNLDQHTPTIIGNQSAIDIAVSYFLSISDVIAHTNLLPSLQDLPVGQSIFYAKIYNISNVTCYNITPIAINLIEKPILKPNLELIGCDSYPYDNVEMFDLTTISNEIIESDNANNYSISYHTTQSDALTNSNALSLSYTNTFVTETLFVRVENNTNPTCFSIETLLLKVIQEPVVGLVSDFVICEDNLPNDGMTVFNLSIKETEILNGQSVTDFDVVYYLTNSDAQNDLNPLDQFFTNNTNPQTIYLRVFNVALRSCYKVTSFNLFVKPKPDFSIDPIYTICDGTTSITVTVQSGFSNYAWSNGNLTPIANFFQSGNYSVTVGQQYGSLLCETTQSFNVLASNAATIEEIATVDFNGNNNVISINVVGLGDYEYSLDGLNYQDSNVFYGLNAGEYSVFVRDKNGCGITLETIYLLNYPKFFTPNNDGYNDYWRINFSSIIPSLEIKIFDRYGKFVTVLDNDSVGWDGKLNGQELISDDYWFVVTIDNRKDIKGHFTLKR